MAVQNLVMTLMPSCDYMSLIPRESDREDVARTLELLGQEGLDDDEIEELMLSLLGDDEPLGRYYEPYCRKTRSCCVVMESPILALKSPGNKRKLCQPFAVTFGNRRRIESCDKREYDYLDVEPLTEFLRTRIDCSKRD